jgi:hypothetical protein
MNAHRLKDVTAETRKAAAAAMEKKAKYDKELAERTATQR